MKSSFLFSFLFPFLFPFLSPFLSPFSQHPQGGCNQRGRGEREKKGEGERGEEKNVVVKILLLNIGVGEEEGGFLLVL